MAESIDSRVLVRRHPERGQYDLKTIASILDEALYCHVSVVRHGTPVIIPTLHVRIENQLYFHGAPAAGLFRGLGTGQEVAVAVTLLDGLVLARSAYNHSLNYRSVVVFGAPYEVVDMEVKNQVLEALVEHVVAGRWRDARPPSDQELKATRVFGIALETASAKIRSGPPSDDAKDMDLPVWAGVVPLKLTAGLPLPDPVQDSSLPQPSYLTLLRERF